MKKHKHVWEHIGWSGVVPYVLYQTTCRILQCSKCKTVRIEEYRDGVIKPLSGDKEDG